MVKYDLIAQSLSYSDTAGILWFNSKEELANLNNYIANTDVFKPFKYKAKLIGKTIAQNTPNGNNGVLKIVTTVVLLKYLSNFWRSLKMPFINCKVESKLK